MDDPELAHYLQPRPTINVPATQELADQLLLIAPTSSHTAAPPRHNTLGFYAELLAEMSADVSSEKDGTSISERARRPSLTCPNRGQLAGRRAAQ